MKYLSIFFCTAIIVLGCQERKKSHSAKLELSDTIRVNGMTKQEFVDHYVDSVKNSYAKTNLIDTTGLFRAPVKILKARLYKEEYSNYKSISLTFKNVSGKRIDAIKFKWYGEDAFGEPADMGTGGFFEGFGGGFTDDPLGSGQTRTSSWSIYSSRGKKVVLAWPYEVAFSDGTKWDISIRGIDLNDVKVY